MCQQDRPTVGSSAARQLDHAVMHPLVVLRWSSCKQTRIT